MASPRRKELLCENSRQEDRRGCKRASIAQLLLLTGQKRDSGRRGDHTDVHDGDTRAAGNQAVTQQTQS